MTEDEMRTEFHATVTRMGGCRAFARHAGLHHSVVTDALNGGPVPPKLLAALGLERVVTYRARRLGGGA